MSISYERIEMPEEYDAAVLIQIFNSHASGIAQLHDELTDIMRKVRAMNGVVWALAKVHFPETTERVISELEQEHAPGAQIDDLFKDPGESS